MLFSKKRGQGAFEYLMVYGWALMVILIMIGTLAYFGVLNPTKYLPDRCYFGAPLLCKPQQFTIKNTNDGSMIVRLVNNYGSTVKIKDAKIITDLPQCETHELCITNGISCDEDDAIFIQPGDDVYSWPEGISKNLVVDCDDGVSLPVSSKVKVVYKMRWYTAASTEVFAKSFEGEIYANVQDTGDY